MTVANTNGGPDLGMSKRDNSSTESQGEAPLQETPYGTTDVDTDSEEHLPHPRTGIPNWKWKLMLLGNGFLALLSGYDVSNVANIQAPIYEAFGHIELLPWVGLSYSVVNVACVPLARKLTRFCDFKTLSMSSLIFVVAGSALAGAAPNMQCVIAGRAIMAIGSAVVYQCALSFVVVFAYPHEQGLAQALLGAMFAIGLLTGPLIGGAFAENENATWRWAFYFAIVLCGLIMLLLALGLPRYRQPTKKTAMQHLKEIDWIGNILHMGTLILFASACIFCGPTWDWDSGSSIAIWTVWGAVLICYVVQQTFSLGTTPDNRIFPCRLLNMRIALFTWFCTICAAISYGITLYYTPLFFAFVHGHDPVSAAVRLLPFIGPFIFFIFLSGGALPAVRYYMPFYIFSAVFILIGAGLMTTIEVDTTEGAVMGYTALLGAGLGLIFNLSPPICSAALPNSEDDRLDQAAIHNMAQLGGTAVALSIAGAIYQNVGYSQVSAAVAPLGDFSEEAVRTMLAGVDSPILASEATNPAVLAAAVHAVVETIVDIFYMLLAAGAICFISACCLRFEPLTFRKPTAPPTTDGEEAEKAADLEQGRNVKVRQGSSGGGTTEGGECGMQAASTR